MLDSGADIRSQMAEKCLDRIAKLTDDSLSFRMKMTTAVHTIKSELELEMNKQEGVGVGAAAIECVDKELHGQLDSKSDNLKSIQELEEQTFADLVDHSCNSKHNQHSKLHGQASSVSEGGRAQVLQTLKAYTNQLVSAVGEKIGPALSTLE